MSKYSSGSLSHSSATISAAATTVQSLPGQVASAPPMPAGVSATHMGGQPVIAASPMLMQARPPMMTVAAPPQQFIGGPPMGFARPPMGNPGKPHFRKIHFVTDYFFMRKKRKLQNSFMFLSGKVFFGVFWLFFKKKKKWSIH